MLENQDQKIEQSSGDRKIDSAGDQKIPGKKSSKSSLESKEKAEYAKTALRILYELTLDTELTGNIRLQAANSLLDRLWGKTDKKSPLSRAQEGETAGHQLEALSDQELLGLIEEQGAE